CFSPRVSHFYLSGTLSVRALSLLIAESASLRCRAARVDRSTASSDRCPVIDMISCAVAPRSASRAAVAFLNPWAEQWGRPASLHHSLNLFPNPAGEKGFP